MKKIICILSLILLSACNAYPNKQTIHYVSPISDIDNNIVVPLNTNVGIITANELLSKDMQKTFDETIIYYHILLDPAHNYEGINNLKTINDNYGKGKIQVDKELIEIIKDALEISKLTDGYFNPTVGALSNVWKPLFNEEHFNDDPDEKQIQNALSSLLTIDEYDKYIIIDEQNNTIEFKKKEDLDEKIIIDLGAIAKGYILDKAYNSLLKYDSSFLISAGGSSIISHVNEKDSNLNWTIGIKDPNSEASAIEFTLKDIYLSTSADNEQFFINKDGIRRHHILNPYTGFSSNYYRSITLTSNDKAFVLDALSTALFSVDNSKIDTLIKKTEDYYNIDIKKVIMEDDSNNKLKLEYDEFLDDIKYKIDNSKFTIINTK